MANMDVVYSAYQVATSMSANDKVLLALFETALVESEFRNLTHGDRDSVGYLQQRPSQGWSNPMHVPTATRSFVSKAIDIDKSNPNLTAGQLAQSVQISAYPDRYDKREIEARALLIMCGKTIGSIPSNPTQSSKMVPKTTSAGSLMDTARKSSLRISTAVTGAILVLVGVGTLLGQTKVGKAAIDMGVTAVTKGAL